MAVAAGWNYNQSKSEVALSDLALANVEALADPEYEEVSRPCPNKGGTCIVQVGDATTITNGYQKNKQ